MFTTHTASLSSSRDCRDAALQGDGGGDRYKQHHSRCLQLTSPPSPVEETVEILLVLETVGETGINKIIFDVYNSHRLRIVFLQGISNIILDRRNSHRRRLSSRRNSY
jgi:hypothetical protein